MKHALSLGVASLTTTWLLSVVASASSAPTPREARPSAPAAALASPSSDTRAEKQREAERRYQRALELYDEGAHDAALSEMKRAYELAPALRILYNLGVMSLAAHDHAAAMEYFEKYLAEGGESIGRADRDRIRDTLAELSHRVAKVVVTTNVPGADVYVDDRLFGKAPLPGPLRLNVGSRRISVSSSGWLPESRVINVAAGDDVGVDLVLVENRTRTAEAPQPTPAPVQTPTLWPGWAAAAALTGVAIACGVEAAAAQSQFERKRRELGITSRELEQADQKAFRWSVASDVASVGALAAFGYTLYRQLSLPGASVASGNRPRIALTTTGIYIEGEY
jgi:hypothetical protein